MTGTFHWTWCSSVCTLRIEARGAAHLDCGKHAGAYHGTIRGDGADQVRIETTLGGSAPVDYSWHVSGSQLALMLMPAHDPSSDRRAVFLGVWTRR